jgi:hypothetical protein
MTRRTMAERKAAVSGPANRVLNLLRRTIAAGTSSATRWSLAGLDGVDGELEAFERGEVFGQAGVACRPADGAAEVVVASIGRMELVVSARVKAGRPALEKDETTVYNSLRAILVNKLGQVLLGKNAADALIKGTTYRAAETTMHGAIATASTTLLAAFTTYAGSAAGPAETKTVIAAIGTFITAWMTAQQTNFEGGSSTYLSTISKTE